MKVYTLKNDSSRFGLIEMSYDVSLVPFAGSVDIDHQLLSKTKVDLPVPVQFAAYFPTVSKTDYPIAKPSVEVMSKKMIEV